VKYTQKSYLLSEADRERQEGKTKKKELLKKTYCGDFKS
jgi:hypothetical protein